MDPSQQLKQDGVDMDLFVTNNNRFQSCIPCNVSFTLDGQLPTLLKCGHVCCEECLQKGKKCFICNQQPKQKKISKYSRYLKPLCLDKYNLFIKIQKNANGMNMPNVAGSNTVQAVLNSYKGFATLITQRKEDQIIVMFGTKSMFYTAIKRRAIGGYLKVNEKNQSIPIVIALKKDRPFGGESKK